MKEQTVGKQPNPLVRSDYQENNGPRQGVPDKILLHRVTFNSFTNLLHFPTSQAPTSSTRHLSNSETANCSLAGQNTVPYKSGSISGTNIEFIWKICDHAFQNCIITLMQNRAKSCFHGYHLDFCHSFTFPTCELPADDSQTM